MTESNPYSPPADLGASGPSAQLPPGPGSPSPNAVDQLRRTRPWTMFLSILGFIGGGLMAFASLFMMIGAASGEMVNEDEAPALFAAAALYTILTGMYLIVSILLFKYGRAIGFLVQFNRNEELDEALGAQRKIWKAMGIIAIVTMGLVAVAMFVGMGIAIAEGL